MRGPVTKTLSLLPLGLKRISLLDIAKGDMQKVGCNLILLSHRKK